MTYELAKRLKDAGFPLMPLEESVYGDLSSGASGSFTFQTDDGMFCVPTLSELIRACGSADFALKSRHDTKEGGEAEWFAGIDGGDVAYGDTPEEAVAKLWLALQERSGVTT